MICPLFANHLVIVGVSEPPSCSKNAAQAVLQGKMGEPVTGETKADYARCCYVSRISHRQCATFTMRRRRRVHAVMFFWQRLFVGFLLRCPLVPPCLTGGLPVTGSVKQAKMYGERVTEA